MKIGPYDVDIDKIPPLTMGDLRDLRRAGVTDTALANGDLEAQVAYVAHLLRKIVPGFDADILWGMTPQDFADVAKAISDATLRSAQLPPGPDPFSTPSTS